jgi:hypothetical protein
MVGFFSYGEMGKSPIGKHEYNNNTLLPGSIKGD